MVRNGCPKCKGSLHLEQGIGYVEWVCLQCGYRK